MYLLNPVFPGNLTAFDEGEPVSVYMLVFGRGSGEEGILNLSGL
jgi:hypothetical protein